MMPTDFQSRIWHFYREIQVTMLRMFTPVVEQAGLTLPQIAVLFEICERPGLTLGQLSCDITMNRGNCSTMCKHLERQGLLRRERNPEDERMVLLSPTPEGRNLFCSVLEKVTQQNQSFFQDMPPEEVQALWESVERISLFLHQLSQTKEEA